MNWTRMKRLTLMLVVAACSLGLASQANALTQADSSFLGSIVDDIPSGNELAFLNTLLDRPAPSGPTVIGTETYTRSANTPAGCCPDATSLLTKDETGGNSVALVAGTQYIVAKYDAEQGGALVWYVGNLAAGTIITVPENFGTCGKEGCGVSHISQYGGTTTVPEPTTLLLLGLGITGIGFLGRKFLAGA